MTLQMIHSDTVKARLSVPLPDDLFVVTTCMDIKRNNERFLKGMHLLLPDIETQT